MAAAAAAAAKLFPGGSLGPAEDMDPTMAVILTNKVISIKNTLQDLGVVNENACHF